MPHLPRRSFLPLAALAVLAPGGPAADRPPAPAGPPGRGTALDATAAPVVLRSYTQSLVVADFFVIFFRSKNSTFALTPCA